MPFPLSPYSFSGRPVKKVFYSQLKQIRHQSRFMASGLRKFDRTAETQIKHLGPSPDDQITSLLFPSKNAAGFCFSLYFEGSCFVPECINLVNVLPKELCQ